MGFSIGSYNQCPSEVTSTSLTRRSIPLKIQHPLDITFTWESTASGSELEVNASTNISFSIESNDAIVIRAFWNNNNTISVQSQCWLSLGSLEVFPGIWWILIVALVLIVLFKMCIPYCGEGFELFPTSPAKNTSDISKPKSFDVYQRTLCIICWILIIIVILLLSVKILLPLITAGLCISASLQETSCSYPFAHVTFPSVFISEVCINNGRCKPTTCNLGLFYEEASSINYNKVKAGEGNLFVDDFCTVKRPFGWNEWVVKYFGIIITSDEFFFIDSDNDGLVNILEFFGDLSNLYSNHSVVQVGFIPNDPDTDNDLLLDGFEIYYGLSPLIVNDRMGDLDNDGLSNLQEQIYGTDPLNPDTDGDGTTDGTEVEIQGDPTDKMDNGSIRASDTFAMVQLTIGDPSPSHSERYNLHVGSISHQSPGFGLVGSGVYKYKPGIYPITVQWVATNLDSPDFDYLADVSKQSGTATMRVEDPDEILGLHFDSTFDRTVDKKAFLFIEAMCNGNDNDTVECYKTCEDCQKSLGRIWDSNKHICRSNIGRFSTSVIPECPCHLCERWYQEELRNLEWLNQTNSEVPCPCKAVTSWHGLGLTTANEHSVISWDMDLLCSRDRLPGCSLYHRGAYGCIQADWKTHRQQCCYDSNLNWIQSGLPAAGTPDKARSIWNHNVMDVEPYNLCCSKCNDKKYCDYHMGSNGVRTGPVFCSTTA